MTTKKTLSDKQCNSLLNDYLSGANLTFVDGVGGGAYIDEPYTYFEQLFEDNPEECQEYVGKSAPNQDHLIELILASSTFQQGVKKVAKQLASDFQGAYKYAASSYEELEKQEKEEIKKKQSEFDLAQSLSPEQKEALNKLYDIKLPTTKKTAKKTK
jgi:hypothetical protein